MNKIIESLYFSCYYSFLLGNINNTRLYYDILRHEFKDFGTKEALTDFQFLQLKKIKASLETGDIPRNTWLNETPHNGIGDKEKSQLNQKDLIIKIHASCDQLISILNDPVELYNLEHPCQPYGRVDMVYKGPNTIYPVEIKKDQGKHDLIGQIMKYDLFHKLLLHYKHYENVQSVTICKSYDPFTLKELKKMGIITICYSFNKDKINLSLI